MRYFKNFSYLCVALFVLGCVNENDLEDPIIDNSVDPDHPLAGLNVSVDFDYVTSKSVTLQLDVPNYLSNAVLSVYSKVGTQDSLFLGKVGLSNSGSIEKEFLLASAADSILLYTNYIGLIDNVRLPIEGNNATFDYRPFYERSDTAGKQSHKPLRKGFVSKTKADYTFIDTFDFLGVPDNLAFPDVIEQNLLDDLCASLPESAGGVPVNNPEYLAGTETNFIVTQEADVWVTFVSEGAGYRNVLGYYTYPLGQEPATVDDITAHNVIFPNTSFLFSGGGLISGDRVYLGRFPENTVIAWFIAANGWTGSGVSDGNGVYYSNPDFNPESTPENREHMVLLYDEFRELAILGFEDLNRDGGSDDDFNDAVFYAKANPPEAVQISGFAEIEAANDADGDGVNDSLDDFPFDPNEAFNNFAPAENSVGKVVYEDLWPFNGDYDFNDTTINYRFVAILNSDNMAVQLDIYFEVSSDGAGFVNAFGIELESIAPSLIESVTGTVLTEGYINVAANGVEQNQSRAVIILFDNHETMLGIPSKVEVKFATPITTNQLGLAPFNPFLIVDRNRGNEIHLPNRFRTSLGENNPSAEGVNRDVDGNYQTESGLPWAINIVHNFKPPKENVPVNQAYNFFNEWATSGGTAFQDWYKDSNGYRNESALQD